MDKKWWGYTDRQGGGAAHGGEGGNFIQGGREGKLGGDVHGSDKGGKEGEGEAEGEGRIFPGGGAPTEFSLWVSWGTH